MDEDEASDGLYEESRVENLVERFRRQQFLARIQPTQEPWIMVDKYRVEKLLGRGGMGVVFLAVDTESEPEQRVALKTYRQRPDDDQARQGRLRRELFEEARVMRGIVHKNIVEFIDVFTWEDMPFIVMEYIHGPTLKQWLASDPPPSLSRRISALRDIGEALAEVHANQLFHQDIKPTNIMFDQWDVPRLMDFGLAGAPSDLADTLTTNDVALAGTLAYMAPEHHRGKFSDALTDQFSYCMTFYEAMYGERPFVGETLHAYWNAGTNGDFRPPPKGSRVPAEVRMILHKGLDAERSKRYATIRELLDDLEQWIESRLTASASARFGVPELVQALMLLAALGVGASSAFLFLGFFNESGAGLGTTTTATSTETLDITDTIGDGDEEDTHVVEDLAKYLDVGTSDTSRFRAGEPCRSNADCESGACIRRPCSEKVSKGIPVAGGIGGTEFPIPDGCIPIGKATMTAGCGDGTLTPGADGTYRTDTNGIDHCYGTVKLGSKGKKICE